MNLYVFYSWKPKKQGHRWGGVTHIYIYIYTYFSIDLAPSSVFLFLWKTYFCISVLNAHSNFFTSVGVKIKHGFPNTEGFHGAGAVFSRLHVTCLLELLTETCSSELAGQAAGLRMRSGAQCARGLDDDDYELRWSGQLSF